MNDTTYIKPQLDEVRARYPEYLRSEHAYREAAALWGCIPGDATINDCGVFVNHEAETFTAGRCTAEIHLAPAPNGLWAMALSYTYHTGGGGTYPSIWNDVAFRSRDAAYKAGIRELIDRFTTLREQTADSRRILKILEEAQFPQLSLF